MQIQTPFDDLLHILTQLPDIHEPSVMSAYEGEGTPPSAQADTISGLKLWLAGWQENSSPSVAEAHICVLASCYDEAQTETVQGFIKQVSRGNAPVNRLCVDHGIGLRVLELAPEVPHVPGDGWSVADCMAAIAFGMEATAAGGSLLGLSSFSPGAEDVCLNVVSALSAEYSALTKRNVKALSPLEALRCMGGREIAASVGAIIAARSRRLPVVVDGWPALTAIATLEQLKPQSTDHVLIASATSALYKNVAALMGKPVLVTPIIEAEAGCGAAVAVSVLKAACDL